MSEVFIAALVEGLMHVAFWAIVIGVPCYVWVRVAESNRRHRRIHERRTCTLHRETYPMWQGCLSCRHSRHTNHEGRW